MTPGAVILSLDVGGSHVTAALVDLPARRILPGSLERRSTAPDWPARQLLDTWADTARLAFEHGGASPADLNGISVAIPSPFDYASGVSHHHAKFASLRGMDVTAALRERWHGSPLSRAPRPRYANDAALFTLGEAWAGGGVGAERVLGVTLGTGLGSGFVRRGRLLTQGEGVPEGGEIWNLPYEDGVAEDSVSTAALIREYAGRTGAERSGEAIGRLARRGDPHALAALRTYGTHLGRVLRRVAAPFGPDAVVLGGNLARAWERFGEQVTSRLGAPVHVSSLFEEAALLGGAALHRAVPGPEVTP